MTPPQTGLTTRLSLVPHQNVSALLQCILLETKFYGFLRFHACFYVNREGARTLLSCTRSPGRQSELYSAVNELSCKSTLNITELWNTAAASQEPHGI